MTQLERKGILSGIRVVDIGRFIAGPYCATLLADLGADVIRVERPGGGEDRYVAPVAASGEGGSYLQTGRNKRSLCLDLTSARGREALHRLIATADVLVANLPCGQLRKLGLDYSALARCHPRLIVTTANAFGHTGPLADAVGFDGIGQAMSGAAYLSGTVGAPTRWAATYVDFGTALGCALGTLAALIERGKSGKGQQVQASLLRTALTFFNSNLIETSARGIDRTPSGNRGQQMAPSDIFRTLDGHVLIQVLGNRQFHRLARLIGQAQWIDDPGLQSDFDRGRHADAICDAVQAWTAERNCHSVLAAMARIRIPAQQVLSPMQALQHPQVLDGKHLRPMSYPSLTRDVPIAAPLIDLSANPATFRTRAPLPGEHTQEILVALGYSTHEIAEMTGKAKGGQAP